jgi:DNA polymerase-3 subunit beta
MMGIYWDIKPEEIVFVASDTHKLVRYTEKGISTGLEQSFILPTKPASILSSILDKKDGDIVITLDSKSATFETDDYSLTCRFVNGKYPNYNSVIPQNNQYCMTIDRLSLLNALRRVSVFASAGGLVKLDLKSNEVFMSTQDVDFSTSAEEKTQCEYDGEAMVIGFNDENIIEVLSNINSDEIKVMLLDPSRAGIFLPVEQKDDEDLLILLMPMMI